MFLEKAILHEPFAEEDSFYIDISKCSWVEYLLFQFKPFLAIFLLDDKLIRNHILSLCRRKTEINHIQSADKLSLFEDNKGIKIMTSHTRLCTCRPHNNNNNNNNNTHTELCRPPLAFPVTSSPPFGAAEGLWWWLEWWDSILGWK